MKIRPGENGVEDQDLLLALIRYLQSRMDILYSIEGGGHIWPGTAVPIPGNIVTHDINATHVMWDFFANHPMR